MYKKEAEEHQNKKQADRQRKIIEEREYLHQIDQRENERDDRMRLEKIRKINEHMGDYQRMLQHQQPPKFRSRISDVKINNYGYNVAGNNSSYQELPRNYSAEPSQYQPVSNSFNTQSSRDCPPKDIDLVRRGDNMGNYLTDKQNEGEVNNYYMNQKNERQKYYKELLDSQVYQFIY